MSLTREFKDKFSRREDCPAGKNVVVTFQLTSSIIGVSRPAFVIDFAEDPLADDEFATSASEEENVSFDAYDSSLSAPSASIESISMTGVVVVSFSHPQTVSDDIRLAERTKEEQAQILEVTVEPVEGQTKESVTFSWTLDRFSANELTL